MFTIYELFNTKTGKAFYVGRTTLALKTRLSRHQGKFRSIGNQFPHRLIFKRFKQYGQNIAIRQLTTTTDENLARSIEKHFIEKNRKQNPRIHANMRGVKC